jgi:hypothetical protein
MRKLNRLFPQAVAAIFVPQGASVCILTGFEDELHKPELIGFERTGVNGGRRNSALVHYRWRDSRAGFAATIFFMGPAVGKGKQRPGAGESISRRLLVVVAGFREPCRLIPAIK